MLQACFIWLPLNFPTLFPFLFTLILPFPLFFPFPLSLIFPLSCTIPRCASRYPTEHPSLLQAATPSLCSWPRELLLLTYLVGGTSGPQSCWIPRWEPGEETARSPLAVTLIRLPGPFPHPCSPLLCADGNQPLITELNRVRMYFTFTVLQGTKQDGSKSYQQATAWTLAHGSAFLRQGPP